MSNLIKKKWVMWVSLFAFMPLGLFLLWIHQDDYKTSTKVLISILFIMGGLTSLTASTVAVTEENGNIVESESDNIIQSERIYDNVEIVDVMNGSKTEKIGEYSLISADSFEITDDVLDDWYFNHVAITDYSWYIIVYSDKSEPMGIYANHGAVTRDVVLNKESENMYSLGDSSQASFYFADENTLILQEN